MMTQEGLDRLTPGASVGHAAGPAQGPGREARRPRRAASAAFRALLEKFEPNAEELRKRTDDLGNRRRSRRPCPARGVRSTRRSSSVATCSKPTAPSSAVRPRHGADQHQSDGPGGPLIPHDSIHHNMTREDAALDLMSQVLRDGRPLAAEYPLVFGEGPRGTSRCSRPRASRPRPARGSAHPGHARVRGPRRSWAPSPPAPTAGVRASEPRSSTREQGRERGRRPLAPLGGRSVLVPGARLGALRHRDHLRDRRDHGVPAPRARRRPRRPAGRRRHPQLYRAAPFASTAPRTRPARCSASRPCGSSSRSRPAGRRLRLHGPRRGPPAGHPRVGRHAPGRAALRVRALAHQPTRPSACS